MAVRFMATLKRELGSFSPKILKECDRLALTNSKGNVETQLLHALLQVCNFDSDTWDGGF